VSYDNCAVVSCSWREREIVEGGGEEKRRASQNHAVYSCGL